MPDIPTIDIRYLTTEVKQMRDNKLTLTEENKKKIQSLLKTSLPKTQAIKDVGLTLYQYNNLIELYSIQVDSDIYDKLDIVFHRNRHKRVRRAIMNSIDYSSYPNNLYKLKLEKDISNAKLSRLTHYVVTSAQISLICTRKVST